MIGEEENGEGTKEFTEVRPTNDDLRPGTGAENTLCEGGGEGVFHEPVKVEGHGVAGEEPCKTAEQLHDAHVNRKTAYT